MNMLIVFIAAGLGGVARYAIALAVARDVRGDFPVATLLVNVLGCLAIGLAAGLLSGPGPTRESLRLAVMVGFLGGFTTYSAFARETLVMMNNGQGWLALLYVLASNAGGIGAAWLGLRLASGLRI